MNPLQLCLVLSALLFSVGLGAALSRSHAILVLLGVGIGGYLARNWFMSPVGRRSWEGFILRVPTVGLLVAQFAMSRFCRMLGTLLGALAGFYGGRIDSLISRMVDVWMSFPPVLLSIVLVSVLGTGLWSVIAAIVIVDWTRFCRVVRAETQAQAALDYVVSARMLGMRAWQILWHDIRPNVMPLLITLFTLEMGVAIVVEAILSFVGLSLSSGAATWGGMVGEGRLYVNQAPWLMVFPMLLMMLAGLGLLVVALWLNNTGRSGKLKPA